MARLIEAWFDGCCEPKNPGGHAAWGAVVHVDGESVYRDGGYCGVGPKMSNNVAEYSGFLAALTEALKFPGPIIVRGDSKLVIMQMCGKWRAHRGQNGLPDPLYYPFYVEAKAAVDKERNRLKFEWIPRDKNDICDVLSKKVLKDMNVTFRIQPEEVA